MHGGRVQAESRGVNQGSVFRVWLPLMTNCHDAISVEPQLPGPNFALANRSGIPAKRIVLIDDLDDSREMLQTLLELDGHKVMSANDGESGVKSDYEPRWTLRWSISDFRE